MVSTASSKGTGTTAVVSQGPMQGFGTDYGLGVRVRGSEADLNKVRLTDNPITWAS